MLSIHIIRDKFSISMFLFYFYLKKFYLSARAKNILTSSQRAEQFLDEIQQAIKCYEYFLPTRKLDRFRLKFG